MNPYLIGGMALVILILGWQLKSSLKENGILEANLITANAETNEAADANETNQVTISKLKAENKAMIEERRLDAVRREQVLDEREQELIALRAEAKLLREKRDEAFTENPDCIDLASLSIEFFCPINGGSLRDRSTSQGSH
jgi:hypothetical protein